MLPFFPESFFGHSIFKTDVSSIAGGFLLKFLQLSLKIQKFETLGPILANGVFSPIHVEIRLIRVLSSLLCIFWILEASIRNKNRFFEARRRFAQNVRD